MTIVKEKREKHETTLPRERILKRNSNNFYLIFILKFSLPSILPIKTSLGLTLPTPANNSKPKNRKEN